MRAADDRSWVPRWLRIVVALAVLAGWLTTLIVDAVSDDYQQPALIYVALGVVVGGIFGTEARRALSKGINVKIGGDDDQQS